MNGSEKDRLTVWFDRLEDRQLMSATTESIGLTAGAPPAAPASSTAQAAPPPVVVSSKSATTSAAPVRRIPVLGGTTTQQSGPVRVITATAGKTETVSTTGIATGFKVFDATWGGSAVAGAPRIWWTGQAVFSSGHGDYSPTEARVRAAAAMARDGGTAWGGVKVTPGMPTVLDFELDQTKSLAWIEQRVKWFKETAPNVPLGIYGYDPLGGANRDQIINPTPALIAKLDAQAKAAASLVGRLDFLLVDCYMLGPAYVDRDLAFLKAQAQRISTACPDKPLYVWSWGAYHTAWNKAHSVLSQTVTDRYVAASKQYTDGMIVWGPRQDDTRLLTTALK